MKIKRFRAKNFRNISECEIEFNSEVNILLGKNAQGKTNAIEGIYLFARGKSHRAKDEKELIKFGEKGFSLSIEYEDNLGDNTLEYTLFGKERRRKKNGYKISRAKDMVGNFKSVLFTPDDLRLVKEGPEERRAFLNVAIGQIYSSYISFYSNYKNALENRNVLIKKANGGEYVDRAEILSWSKTLAGYAADIYILRRDYIKKLELYAKRVMSDISENTEEICFHYKSNISEELENKEKIEEAYNEKFSSNIEREIAAGTTLYGIHRDDLEIYLNGKEARVYSSQGQSRSIVLSLKIAEGEVNREICGEYPVFLFDDVLSELDEKRRKYLLSKIKDKQIIISSCERDFIDGISDEIIAVEGGVYTYVSAHR
jgi:DNA replication and repair protein RecF